LPLFEDILITQIAEKELRHRDAIEWKLDYISRHLEQIEMVQQLPEAYIKSALLKNRAIDVLSASMLFLAATIDHEVSKVGLIGSSLRHVG